MVIDIVALKKLLVTKLVMCLQWKEEIVILSILVKILATLYDGHRVIFGTFEIAEDSLKPIPPSDLACPPLAGYN